MKTEENQKQRFDFLFCKYRGEDRCDQCKANIVAKHMMIIAPPRQRMAGVLREPFRNNPEAINVGQDARPRDHGPLAPRERRRETRHGPAHEKMRDGTHRERDYLNRPPDSTWASLIEDVRAFSVNNFVLQVFRFGETKDTRDERVSVQIPAWILEPGRQDLPQVGRSIRALIPHSGSADQIRPFAALFFCTGQDAGIRTRTVRFVGKVASVINLGLPLPANSTGDLRAVIADGISWASQSAFFR
jgi:hypothetical protein